MTAAVGQFATARRGGLSLSAIEAQRSRMGRRATPSQIAKALGVCEIDVRSLLAPPVEVAVEPAGFAWTARDLKLSALMFEMDCDVEDVARSVGCTLEEAAQRRRDLEQAA